MKNKIFGSAMITLIVIGAIIGVIVLSTSDIPTIIQSGGQRGWMNVALGAPADPGAGNGGFLEVFIYPHAAVPGTTYNANLSEGTAYAYANSLSAAMTGSVSYLDKFDIVYQVRYNVTQAWNTSSSAWETSWTRCLITSADLGIGSDTTMTGVTIGFDTNYIWISFYMNNGGAGYQLYHGQAINISSFKMQYYG